MQITSKALAVLAVSFVLSSAPARADSILSESMSISGTMPLGGTVDTSQFTAFNPTLGTLVFISVSLSGTLDYTGMGINEGASLELEDESFPSYYANLANVFIPALGMGLPFSFTASGVTDPMVLSDYTGTGSRYFIVYFAGGTGDDQITMNGSGTVTFDYIPATVPEPTAIGQTVLFLLGMISALRRSTHSLRSNKSRSANGTIAEKSVDRSVASGQKRHLRVTQRPQYRRAQTSENPSI
jgi:hypothetical protein